MLTAPKQCQEGGNVLHLPPIYTARSSTTHSTTNVVTLFTLLQPSSLETLTTTQTGEPQTFLSGNEGA